MVRIGQSMYLSISTSSGLSKGINSFEIQPVVFEMLNILWNCKSVIFFQIVRIGYTRYLAISTSPQLSNGTKIFKIGQVVFEIENFLSKSDVAPM